MYAEMGKQSNTMIFSERPADINTLLAQASKVISGALAVPSGPSAAREPIRDSPGATSTLAPYEDLLGDKYTGK